MTKRSNLADRRRRSWLLDVCQDHQEEQCCWQASQIVAVRRLSRSPRGAILLASVADRGRQTFAKITKRPSP
eukprot:3782388-Karenia_brevis.AAC.1